MAEEDSQLPMAAEDSQSPLLGRALAVTAGGMAAMAAVFAKLAGSSPRWEVRLASYACVVACNVAMWTLYVRSLTSLPSLQATVFNFAANFLLSGMAGWLLFGEADVTQWQWVLGASLIVLGIMVLSKADADVSAKKQD